MHIGGKAAMPSTPTSFLAGIEDMVYLAKRKCNGNKFIDLE